MGRRAIWVFMCAALLCSCTAAHRTSTSPSNPTQHRVSSGAAQPKAQVLALRLELQTRTARAGTFIHGTLRISNLTGRPLPVSCYWFQVGLQTGDLPFEPPWPLSLCVRTRGIPAGDSSQPFTIAPVGHGAVLPAGQYSAVLVFEPGWNYFVPAPAAVPVVLT